MTPDLNTPFFSVIIPLYNKENYIEKTLKSVLNQSFKDFEIVIVDDGSTDKSLDIIENFQANNITILKQKNSGVSIARNKGVQVAQANFIAFLDADDLWYENHLFELNKQIIAFPNVGLYCNNYEIYHTNEFCKPAELNLDYNKDCLIVPNFFTASITNCLAWTSAVAVSKKTFEDIGGFDPDLKTFQDLDLWIRIALNYDISFNPTITMSYHFFIDDSLSKNEYNIMRYNGLKKYHEYESKNSGLKQYLDINRYALAIRCLLNNEDDIYKKLKTEINFKNLNVKQRILLKTPKHIVFKIKSFQKFLIKNKLYLTAYN
ncbi:glycosyltransferase [Algibacter mikhailovii]|uniref:glycosyltransferase n=1 Tax=Algibacter mikhailovii TaxID=425498 RepID=UPI0024945F6E|nr:glycosyltransferase [Algibacter mikhailovii]